MLPLMELMAGAGALNEATTGREQQQRDAKLKATAYRMQPYLKSINPESINVHQPHILGAGIQGLVGGMDLENEIALRDLLNSKTDKNKYDIGALDEGKMNGENLDLGGNATGASGYTPTGYKRYSLMNGYL